MDDWEVNHAREPVVEFHDREGAAAVAAAAAAAGGSDDALSEPGGDDDESIGTHNSNIDGSESEDDEEDADDDVDDDLSDRGSDASSSDGSDGSGIEADEELQEGAFEEESQFAGISFRAAVELLEESEAPPIELLCVSMRAVEEGELDDDAVDVARAFRRFVAALGRGEGGRAVQEIDFRYVDWQWLPGVDVERLLVDVLPSHPTIKKVWSDVPAKYVKVFTSALPTEKTTPLYYIGFHGPTFDHESAKALADMIRRDVAIEYITLEPLQEDNYSGGLDASDVKLICQALPGNTKLRDFVVKTKEVLPDTLDEIASSSSSLRHFMVYSGSPYPDESLASIAQQLKTNTTMQYVFLYRWENDTKFHRPERFRPLEEALETYNYSLRTVVVGGSDPRWDQQDFVEKILRRNGRIQQAIEQLHPRDYHVAPTVLVPHVFKLVSGIPTLLYRFLRKGNVNTFCDLLLQADRGAEAAGEAAGDADAGVAQG